MISPFNTLETKEPNDKLDGTRGSDWTGVEDDGGQVSEVGLVPPEKLLGGRNSGHVDDKGEEGLQTYRGSEGASVMSLFSKSLLGRDGWSKWTVGGVMDLEEWG